MKIAVVGSRDLFPSEDYLEKYIENASEIVSGGAKGVDTCAENYAKKHNLKLTVFLPKYEIYGRIAPLKRNEEIVNYSDKVLVFWNGISRGSLYVINYAKKVNKECIIVNL